MREKYLWLAIIFLLLLTMGQSCYIYERNATAKDISEPPRAIPEIYQKAYSEKAFDAQREELGKWRDRIQNELDRGNPLGEPDFDVFFDDAFFSRKPDPFTEMEQIHRHMSDRFQGSEKSAFEDYWDKWFAQRLAMGQFKTGLTRTASDVTLTIDVPGLSGKTADIDITADRIKISFSAATSSSEKSAAGVVKKESSQNYIKILPLPPDAVAGTGKVEITGQQVKIKFGRRKN